MDCEIAPGMSLVYRLDVELSQNPERVRLAQELTLDENRPRFGLKGTHGLFGSTEWWGNIEKQLLQTRTVSGDIEEVYWAGQDARWGDAINSFRYLDENGDSQTEGIYVNSRQDVKKFMPGVRFVMVYVIDELKTGESLDIMLYVYIGK